MFQVLPSDESVIAVQVGGRLAASELEAMLARVEARLNEGERTELYIEVEDGTGIEVDGLAGYLRRAAGLLGKLKHLGRVAIVSDERWVRGAAKLESAILPNVHYEVFRCTERERALAWVKGERALPRDPALTIIETDRPDVHGFELDGKVTSAELAAAADYFGALIERGRPLRLLGRIRRFGGMDLAALGDRDFVAMKRGILGCLERYALVGGPAWLPAWVHAIDPLVKADVRHFEDEARAWEWLGAEPIAERPLLADRKRRAAAARDEGGRAQPRE